MKRNDEITCEEANALNPEKIVISPGPCTPLEAGISVEIIKIIEKIREIPINQRERSILILLDPEHFTPGRHSIDWFKKHSELSSKISSVVAVEHLGQMEFIEKNNEYGLSGKEDRTYIYSQNNQR